ncbi:MAG TPA: RDD family protein [Gallionellaceae bacterium]|nr:RDD family protein [Gallionellaceae bacterium]
MNDVNPYRAPSAEIADIPENGELELAGIGHRFGAFVIDLAISLSLLFALAYASGTFDAVWDSEDSHSGAAEMSGITFALFILTQSYFLKKHGQTIGKKIVGIRIVDRDGNLPGLGRLLFRRYLPICLYNAISVLGTLLAVIDVLLVFRRDRRCLHDMLAGTRVVMHNARHSSITWFIGPAFTLLVASITISTVDPMLDSPPPKPAVQARKTAPKTQPTAPKPPAQTASARSTPAPAANALPAGNGAANHPALAQAAATPVTATPGLDTASAQDTAPAAPQPSEAKLRKCATLGDAAAIIRCSQGGR